MSWFLVLFVRAYQMVLSPLMPPACRYYPSCSNYAIEALEKHGAWRGGWMAVRRILRCHPFHPGGFDPVP
jgi:putative membrane protein insertion efficiency factor